MRRRKDTDMEALQGIVEDLLAMLDGNGAFDEGLLAQVDSEDFPEYLQVEISGKYTGMDMLPDEDKEDLSDLKKFLDPGAKKTAGRGSCRQLRGRIREFILQQPKRYLAALSSSSVDALESLLEEQRLSFEDWIDDVQELADLGFCLLEDEPKVVVPAEYAACYRAVLADRQIMEELAYWADVEEAARGVLDRAGAPVSLEELKQELQREVKPAEMEGGDEKIVSLAEKTREKSEQEAWLSYVLTHRLDNWASDILMTEEDGVIRFSLLEWMEDPEDFDDLEDWDDEDFDDEDWDDEDLDDEDWDDEDWDEEDFEDADIDDENRETDDILDQDTVLWIDVDRFQKK